MNTIMKLFPGGGTKTKFTRLISWSDSFAGSFGGIIVCLCHNEQKKKKYYNNYKQNPYRKKVDAKNT